MVYRGPGFLMIWLLTQPLCPLLPSISQKRKEIQLADRTWGEEWGRSQIIRRRESLVLYNHSIQDPRLVCNIVMNETAFLYYVQENNDPSNFYRSHFIYFFQFDFGCTTYVLQKYYGFFTSIFSNAVSRIIISSPTFFRNRKSNAPFFAIDYYAKKEFL
jgi:hypothetical protein